MKKKARIRKTPIILLAAAAVCLLLSTAGSAKATLTYISEHYSAQVELYHIGVTLRENEEDISWRDYIRDDTWREHTGVLVEHMLEDGESLKLGKAYEERLSVANSGGIDSYVRVILTKSWHTKEGKKDPTLSPDLIDLHLLTGDNHWVIDESASTPERTILYYTEILPVGEETEEFSDTLTIDPALGSKVNETVTTDVSGRKTIRYTYEYDGYCFNIDAEVDAVQTHNAADAIKSAWGVDAEVISDSGSIRLK